MGRLLALCAAASLALASCSDKPERLVAGDEGNEPSPKKAVPFVKVAQQLEDVIYSQSKGDKLQWKLEARTVEQSKRGRTNLESVEITYYSDDGRVTVLTAESALYDENARNATLRGNVIVKTSDGGSLSTDSLKWDQEKEMLRGEGKVRITRGGSIINGKGFELSPTDETFRIYEVGGTIHQGDWDL